MNIKYLKTKLKRYRPLGHILAEHLGKELVFVNSADDAKGFNDYLLTEVPFRTFYINWDSKTYQYSQLSFVTRVPDYKIYDSLISLMYDIDNIKKKFGKFVVSKEYSSGGTGTIVIDENTEKVYLPKGFGKLRVSEYLPNVVNVSLHFIIAEINDIWLSPIVDQIMDGVTFKGAQYPSKITNGEKSKVYQVAHDVSTFLAKIGYKGLGHIDIMVSDGEAYFCELNPRMAASTMCMSYMMEQCYNYSIPIIQYYAEVDKTIIRPTKIRKGIPWKLEYIPYMKVVADEPGDERKKFGYKRESLTLYNEYYDRCTFKVSINCEK